MTKEEKIQDAFGKSWSLLSYSMQQHILKVHHWVDRSSNRMNKSPKDLGFDEETECEIHCEFWRPKSLSGIEDNNGWTTDKKPEENENVLIFCDHMQPKVQHAFWDGKDWRQNMFDFDKKVDYKCKIMNVAGWKHLPKPPIY